MTAEALYFKKEQIPAQRPIWLEGLSGLDWLALRCSPIFYGIGAPRGDGSAVVLVPGFLATDFYLNEMFWWLRRLGYKPYRSKIGRNAECLNILVDRLVKTAERAYNETGQKVHLVGHSLGGVLSRAVAGERPDLVASVITLGSPFRGNAAHPLVLDAANRIRQRIQFVHHDQVQPDCMTGFCNCKVANALQSDLSNTQVLQTAIYTRLDGIVDWRYCRNEDPATNFEVLATHVGLAFNPGVYSLIANRLAFARRPQSARSQAA